MAVVEIADYQAGSDLAFDFSKEANHRISNQLAVIASMVQMQATSVARGPETLTRLEVRGLLRETAGKIASIAHLHRKLARQDNVDRIELGEYLIECASILASSLAPQGRVGFVQRLDKNCFVSSQQAQSIGLIVNEVVTNSVKHAHPTGIPVAISIACRHKDNDAIEIEVQDDGVGLPEGFDESTSGGIGFRMMRSLAQTLRADMTIESDDLGMTFRLMIPAAT